MPVKLNHYYSVIPGKEQEYNKFIIKDFIPRMNRMNIHIVAGWSVIVGAYSEIILESVSNDLDMLQKVLLDDKYKELKLNLLDYVTEFKTKVLIKTGSIDSYTIDIKKDTIKFNQMWDIVTDKKDEYDKYSMNVFYPCLEEAGVQIANVWKVFIGDGPHIICEGRVTDMDNLIQHLQTRKFQNIKRDFKEFVDNYQSRILSFHILKKMTYRTASYQLI